MTVISDDGALRKDSFGYVKLPPFFWAVFVCAGVCREISSESCASRAVSRGSDIPCLIVFLCIVQELYVVRCIRNIETMIQEGTIWQFLKLRCCDHNTFYQ